MQSNQGAITPQFRGFNVAGFSVPSNIPVNFDTQMNAYISYTGWTGNLANGEEPAIITTPVTAGIFNTVQIPIGAFTAITSNWVTVFVPTGATPGQKYSTIKNGTSNPPTVARTMDVTYNSMLISYSGSTNLPSGIYRMYTTYVGTGFQLSTSVLPNYFQGGTLVSV